MLVAEPYKQSFYLILSFELILFTVAVHPDRSSALIETVSDMTNTLASSGKLLFTRSRIHAWVDMTGACAWASYWVKIIVEEHHMHHSCAYMHMHKINSLYYMKIYCFTYLSPCYLVPIASQATTNWEYQTLLKNFPTVIRALAANSLANSLADELRSRNLIGDAVHAKATSYGPDITEEWRVKQLIIAILSKIEYKSQRYHDFIEVLRLDGIREDAEAALTLLPTSMHCVYNCTY